ncbi:hypothetical protein V6Z11_D10G034600 [Gossypium hirsutum]
MVEEKVLVGKKENENYDARTLDTVIMNNILLWWCPLFLLNIPTSGLFQIFFHRFDSLNPPHTSYNHPNLSMKISTPQTFMHTKIYIDSWFPGPTEGYYMVLFS